MKVSAPGLNIRNISASRCTVIPFEEGPVFETLSAKPRHENQHFLSGTPGIQSPRIGIASCSVVKPSHGLYCSEPEGRAQSDGALASSHPLLYGLRFPRFPKRCVISSRTGRW